MTWHNQPNDKHTWAFYYYCKRQGDKISIEYNKDKTLNLTIMAYETQEKHGALFPVTDKKSENAPDALGKLKIDGVEYEVAAWSKKSKKGNKYFSLKAQLPENHEAGQNENPTDTEDGDGLPF